MATRKFNPKRVAGNFTGKTPDGRDFDVPFSHYMDGSFMTITYDEDQVTEHVGSDGEVTLVLNANQKATLTVTLGQGSPANNPLSDLIPDASRDWLPVGALTFSDMNGTEVVGGPESWIRKAPQVEYSNAVTGRAWIFGIAHAKIKVGSSAEVS